MAKRLGRMSIALSTVASVPLAIVALSVPAAAQGRPDFGDWTVSVGGAVIAAPFYRGDDDERVLPVPYLRVDYKERASLSVEEGLKITLVENGPWTFGAGVDVDFRREEDDAAILAGLGDIGFSVGPRAFAEYEITEAVSLGLDVFKDVADGHGGAVGKASLRGRLPLGPDAVGGLALGVEFGDEAFTQSLFGVTPAQSASSLAGLPAYAAGAGATEVDLSATYLRRLAPSVALTAVGSVGRLVGDAADSPLVADETQLRAITAVTWSF